MSTPDGALRRSSTRTSSTSLASLSGKNAENNSEEDLESQPKLKLFASPLAHERKLSIIESRPLSQLSISGPVGVVGLRPDAASNIYNDRDSDDDSDSLKEKTTEGPLRDTPEFIRYQETTNIELFYDLFFVANLTTFTDVLDINDLSSLKSYAGFFCILWFLWLQVSLFDVRFLADSVLERIGKACQFGVMIGLAIVGPDFNTSEQNQSTFQHLAIVLMLSRIILGAQYCVILWHVWYYKNSKLPLATLAGTSFVASLVYFGTFFGFKSDDPHGNVFIVWYVTAIVETIINIAVSSHWEVLSFKSTHLVQRMSLLTLIILGEGIIGICKSCATIVENEASFAAALVGTIVSAVIIVYFIYMIYFDWMGRSESFLDVRREIWAFLHFPFHLALVLLVEGVAQFILWRRVVEVIAGINKEFNVAGENFRGNTSIEIAGLLSNITNGIFDRFNPKFTRTFTDAQNSVYAIGNATFNSTEQLADIGTLFRVIQDSIFSKFDIEPPATDNAVLTDPNDEWSRNMSAFMLVFVYFFVAAGLTLVLMTTLSAIIRPQKRRADQALIALNLVLGLGLASLASIVNTQSGFNFAQSSWVIPTVALTFVFVMAMSYIKLL